MTKFTPNKTVINNYIQNKLNEVETEKLELWLADHPEVIQELELDLMLKQGITKQKVEVVNKFWQNWFIFPSLLMGAIAASLVIIPLLTDKIQSVVSNEIYLHNEFIIENTRSTNETTTIKTSSKFVTLKLPIEDKWLNENDEFRVVLKNLQDRIQTINVMPNWNNELPISLKLKTLEPQIIKIEVFTKNKSREKSLAQFFININLKN